MLYQIFSIYDSGVKAWRPPVFARSEREVLDVFREACNSPKNEFAKHPSDFTLFHLGTFNDDSAAFSLLITPVSKGMAIEFITPVSSVASQIQDADYSK